MEDMISLIPGYEWVRQKFNNLAPLKESQVKKNPDPVPDEWDGWVTFWLKHPNEWLYPTVCENTSSNRSGGVPYNPILDYVNRNSELYRILMTPAMGDALEKDAANFASSHSVQMKESLDDDSQVYQAGCKFYVIRDGDTVRYRVCLLHLH
jgi:hypothetical protein